MKRLGVLLALLVGCRPTPAVPPEPAPQPSVGGLATLTEPGNDDDDAAGTGLHPAPPEDLPLPAGVTVVDITDGEGQASFVWRGWFAGDPTHPRISDRIGEWYEDGIERSATEAAYELYLEDIRNGGFSTVSFDLGESRGFDFALSEGEVPLDGIVRLVPGDSDDPYGPDIEVIEVIVGPRGG